MFRKGSRAAEELECSPEILVQQSPSHRVSGSPFENTVEVCLSSGSQRAKSIPKGYTKQELTLLSDVVAASLIFGGARLKFTNRVRDPSRIVLFQLHSE